MEHCIYLNLINFSEYIILYLNCFVEKLELSIIFLKNLTSENKKTYTILVGLAYKSIIKLGIADQQQKSGGGKMNDEEQERKITVIEQRQATMESDIKEIKTDVKEMPDKIVLKINESVDMKIKLAIAETEKKYMGKFIALLIGLIGEGVGLIISFIK